MTLVCAARRSLSLLLASAAVLGGVPSCAPSRGELLIAVYTDLPSPQLASSLRIDVYRVSGDIGSWNGLIWTDSQSFFIDSNARFPATFGLAISPDASEEDYLIRARLGPDGANRDYQGERFSPPMRRDEGSLDDVLMSPPVDAENYPRLLRNGVDGSPLHEPIPSLVVDSLRFVRIRQGERTQVTWPLAGECIGTQADLVGRRSCVNTEHELTTLVSVGEDTPPLKAGTWPQAAGPHIKTECDAAAEALRRKGTPALDGLDEEVCVPGGAFIYGRRGPDDQVIPLDALKGEPEFPQIVILPRFYVDKFEYSVGRWRASNLRSSTMELNNAKTLSPDTESACTAGNVIQRDRYPLTCVPRDFAQQLCHASGGALLTDAQWTYVATNAFAPDATLTPWGNRLEISCEGAWLSHGSAPDTFAQCGRPFGPTDETVFNGLISTPLRSVDRNGLGVLHLEGNVREIVDAMERTDGRCFLASTRLDPTCGRQETGRFGTRGSSWAAGLVSLNRRDRHAVDLDTDDEVVDTTGFRCARKSE